MSVRYDLNDFSLTPLFGYAITEDKVRASESKRDGFDALAEIDMDEF